MSKSLGIYIENNLIKYAKVSKEHDTIKVEAYGVKTFENLTTEIKKIIEETYSFNTPISINLSGEKYLYFDIFALLNKRDIQKSTNTEFETYCEEKKYNKNAFETRYALVQNIEDKDKIKAIDIIVNKIELNRQMQLFESYKLSSVLPIPMAIADIAEINKKENVLIVNMDETATITTVIDKKIYNIETLECGSKETLEKINKSENSYSKAYEICKNTTIYSADMEDSVEEQPYLQYVIPVIYKIREKVQDIILNNSITFDKIYLTGTLAQVNNIDLYFQEAIQSGECKILKPKFITENLTQINVKDYIEVNSAIALAVNDLGEGNQSLNFKKKSIVDKISQMVRVDQGKANKSDRNKGIPNKFNLDFSLGGKFSDTEVWLIRSAVAIILITIMFLVFSKMLSIQMIDKEKQIDELKNMQKTEIAKITTEKSSLESKTEKYKSLIKRLEEEDDRISQIVARKNSIPNFLNQISYGIPEGVQLISIDNTTDKHIVIQAQSEQYNQLGIFISVLKTKEILIDVVSSGGTKKEEKSIVTIEGDLP